MADCMIPALHHAGFSTLENPAPAISLMKAMR
jgi:hypothetical protein